MGINLQEEQCIQMFYKKKLDFLTDCREDEMIHELIVEKDFSRGTRN